jgi:hypothetical protein
LNGDGIVNIHDLLLLIGNWDSAGPIGDVDTDCMVTVHDLLILIAAWGPCS